MIIYKCDICGKVIKTEEKVRHQLNGALTSVDGTISEYSKFRFDLCEDCMGILRRCFKQEEQEEPEEEPEEESPTVSMDEIIKDEVELDELEAQSEEETPKKSKKPAAAKRKTPQPKMDLGKMLALKKAGWTNDQIADEMHLTKKQVSANLYRARQEAIKNGKM